ncbi:putative ATP-binding cassette family ATPase CAF16 Ecym_1500 [Eremothecium cymbalariae DBVPG|uniref:ABC transporter domain-containing protein n=1 Tax=Eremothecium cymbalariae (strain CBS 270.75 / DBVPG 7215 / KCTC 17166 / NRRL Y-17582) TaxID=931890 RepID=G8JMQ9_ERECY|nr:hypothetical protein Ecym_1500 [Eremothecium cymbalariae DBVPG\
MHISPPSPTTSQKPDTMTLAVEVRDLTYRFPNAPSDSLTGINLSIPWKTCTLICGSNGAGKSTLLKLLSGKHLCLTGNIKVDNRDPFAPTNTSANSGLMMTTYLGTEWCHMSIINRDIGVQELLESIGLQYYKERGLSLIKILGVDLCWRMHQLSDGQKRRVQLCMGLLKPFKVLLLDEVTVDLDVVARAQLLKFLQLETESRNCSVIYATHIFDGLSTWPNRIIHLAKGQIFHDLMYTDDIEFTQHSDTDDIVKKTDHKFKIAKTKSLHPLALSWLSHDEGK